MADEQTTATENPVEETSILALEKRIALWNGIESEILESKEVVSL